MKSSLTIGVMVLAAACHLPAGAETITAYCHCTKCTSGSMVTASGVRPMEGTTIAGPRWVPFGTRVTVSGVGTFTVQDRLAKQYEGRWDIYMASHEKAREFGKQELRVTIVQTNAPLIAGR